MQKIFVHVNICHGIWEMVVQAIESSLYLL